MNAWEPADVGDHVAGVVVGLLAHLLQVPLFFAIAIVLSAALPGAPFAGFGAVYIPAYVGISQFLYIGPLLWYLGRRGHAAMFNGVCLAAILTCAGDSLFLALM